MGARLPKLSLNHKLGAIALGLGLLAIPAKVYQGRTVTVHEKELATAVAREEDHVTPSELAAWIVEGRKDYRLIDIRDEKAYREYHIPTAESVPRKPPVPRLRARVSETASAGSAKGRRNTLSSEASTSAGSCSTTLTNTSTTAAGSA